MNRVSPIALSTVLALVALLSSAACTSSGTATPGATPVAATPKLSLAPTLQPWESEWQKAVAVAKDEGKLVLYTSSGTGPRDVMAPVLKDKFGIDLELTTARSAELSPKVDTERRAGLFLADIYTGGSAALVQDLRPKGYLDPIKPILLLPEVTDPKVWAGGGLNFVDKDGMILSFVATATTPLAINTDLVKPGEIKSYQDLLQPKWKGKIILNDPTVDGPGADWYGVARQILGVDFMQKLTAQEPVIIRDHRVATEWLAKAKYPVIIGPFDTIVNEFKQAGAPISGFVPAEGSFLKSGSGSVALFNKAPHPNAARVVINWLLTKEAQVTWQKVMGQQSGRLDVPPGTLDPANLRQDGVKYVYSGSEEALMARIGLMKEAKDIFGALMK